MDTSAVPPNSVQNLGTQEQCRHKNRLQQFAQRAGMQLPVYQTFNEGSHHAPQFRSTVIVDGATFVSPYTFFRRREAEQYVAQFAFENAVSKTKQEGLVQIYSVPFFSKSILSEYAKKVKLEPPTYTTSKTEGLFPMFNTSVNFDGNTFVGEFCKNKKDAEQFAARSTIEWILGQPDISTTMTEIIRSKYKFFDATKRGSDSILPQENNLPLQFNVVNQPNDTINKDREMSTVLAITHDDNVPLKIATTSHMDDTIIKAKDTTVCLPLSHVNDRPLQVPAVACIGSTNRNLPVPAVEPTILPAAEKHTITPAAEISKVEPNILEVPSGSRVGPITEPKQNNEPINSISKPATIPVSSSPCLAQTVQVKTEDSIEGNASQLNSPNSMSGEKRRKKKKSGSSSKKMRMD